MTTQTHPYIGRKVEFRNRLGAMVVGTVTGLDDRCGSMDLDLEDGTRGSIHYPFKNAANRFVE